MRHTYLFFKIPICIVLFFVLNNAQAQKKMPDNWHDSYYNKANTAKDADYLTPQEKEVYYYLNLARLNPGLYAETLLKEYAGVIDNDYEKSLYDKLKEMKPLKVIKPSKKHWESAKCHAIATGKKGIIGHKRIGDCDKYYSGECCSYGLARAKDIVADLLIDEGVPSLGHRKILLGRYQVMGVAIRPHKKYGTNAVIDLGYEKN